MGFALWTASFRSLAISSISSLFCVSSLCAYIKHNKDWDLKKPFLLHFNIHYSIRTNSMLPNDVGSSNVLDLYLGHAHFKSWLEHQTFWYFCDFPQSLQADAVVVPKLDHGNFLPNSFQSILRTLCDSTLVYLLTELLTNPLPSRIFLKCIVNNMITLRLWASGL